MINYGGSITSAFPNTLCSSPSSFTCNLCNLNLHETDSCHQKTYQKCTHCGVNICENCLMENLETYRGYRLDHSEDKSFSRTKHLPNNRSILHFNIVKKEFKQMYNYSKAIIEKLHLLNNTIKTEELTISELNMIKHQVNTKALELIKQINQEKQDLLDQIENTKRKYETILNEQKEYFALSMQYKDELRKVIRRYKEFKADEKCSLSDLLDLYFSVKTISKTLDDYDQIKLVAEKDTTQIKFDERPIFRNLIGKLVPVQSRTNSINDNIETNNLENSKNDSNSKRHHLFEKKDESSKNGKLNHFTKNNQVSLSKDLSKSFSLNDLLNAANELISCKEKDILSGQKNKSAFFNMKKAKYVNKSTPIINADENKNKTLSYSEFNSHSTEEEILSRTNKSQNDNLSVKNKMSLSVDLDKARNAPPPAPPMSQSLISNLTLNSNENNDSKNGKNFGLKSLSKTSIDIDYKQNVNCNKKLNKSIEEQNSNVKLKPKQRLEIDILPSYLSCSKNKLLIASSHGKIRILDLFTYKMQKDELKNLLINGIGMPKKVEDSNFSYAVTNAQMNENEDILNVSNSVIIVSKRELKVLKIENNDPNEDYVFSNPSGICYDIYENLYVCDSGNNRVKVMDNNLNVIKIIDTASSPQDFLSQPKSVATYQDILFICDSANHRILIFQILDKGNDFKFKNVYGYGYGDEYGKLKYPLECCADSKGVLYVRDHHNNRVQLFDTDGTPLPLIEVNSQRETIYSMTVNDNGDIYLAKIVHVQEQDKFGKTNTINKYYIDIY